MSPEQKAQLQYLMRKSRQIPEPVSGLIKRKIKRRSKKDSVPTRKIPTILEQSKQQMKDSLKKNK